VKTVSIRGAPQVRSTAVEHPGFCSQGNPAQDALDRWLGRRRPLRSNSVKRSKRESCTSSLWRCGRASTVKAKASDFVTTASLSRRRLACRESTGASRNAGGTGPPLFTFRYSPPRLVARSYGRLRSQSRFTRRGFAPLEQNVLTSAPSPLKAGNDNAAFLSLA
jgi:hypothetical protein